MILTREKERGIFERRGREGFAKGAKEDKEKTKFKTPMQKLFVPVA